MSSIVSVLHPSVPSWSARHHRPACTVPEPWRDWLFDSSSLTARLQALRPGTFAVKPIAQYYGKPSLLEQQELGLHFDSRLWVREVELSLAGQTLVYARTAIPLHTLTGAERQLMLLGSRSLGSYLFAQPSLQRGPLRVSQCSTNSMGVHWARRSVFSLRKKALMVSEGFTEQLLDFL